MPIKTSISDLDVIKLIESIQISGRKENNELKAFLRKLKACSDPDRIDAVARIKAKIYQILLSEKQIFIDKNLNMRRHVKN